MKLFGKKKKDDEEEIEEESETSPKPTKRRTRRKEKPKEWSKKERVLVLLVLAMTMVLSGVFALSARSWKLPGLPRIQLSIPSFNFFGEETIVLEGDVERGSAKETILSEFRELTHDLSGVYGLYVVNVNDGFEVGVNHLEDFEPASLNKLPLMLLAYNDHESGMFDLDDTYILNNDDKIGGSGSLYGIEEGMEYTYRELVGLMGSQSDNTAYGVVRDELGRDEITSFVAEIGMNDTYPDENVTTPKDVGVYFKSMYTKNIISANSRDELLGYLTDTIYEEWLPRGIPDDVTVAHKFGREVHVVNDAGIVFAEKPFVLVVMSKGIVESEADVVIPQIAQMVYRVQTQK